MTQIKAYMQDCWIRSKLFASYQEDLFNVIRWSLKNNMQLNESKFEVINYKLNKWNCSWGKTTAWQRGKLSNHRKQSVTLEYSFQMTAHGCHTSIRCWTLLRRSYGLQCLQWQITFSKTMVSSRLEYCCPVWNPSYQLNVFRASFVVNDYWDGLTKLDLLSLQRRRERSSWSTHGRWQTPKTHSWNGIYKKIWTKNDWKTY